MSSIVG